MSKKYSLEFKKQAVEKALNRPHNTKIQLVAESLGVGLSSLNRWIFQAKNQELENPKMDTMSKDKRPQDWTLEERLNMIISCASLNEDALNEHCRKQGLYPHHIKQWKNDFANGSRIEKSASRQEIKQLKQEKRQLQKELNRKDKALAETAALLVLQKKVNEIWGTDEDN